MGAAYYRESFFVALNGLYKDWLGNPQVWDLSTDPCEDQWLGIKCDDSQTRVTQILLMNQGLAGTLSTSLGNLTSLTDMDITSNPMLGGPLPAEIRNLIHLERFFVQFCNFSGTIPSEIGNMVSLKYLGLSQNNFTGPLPATVGLLKNLNWLDVSNNNLSGPLPVSSTSGIGSGLDNLTNAQHWHLQNNEFSGPIPPSLFVQGMQLLHLMLRNNKFTGSIPPTIENLVHLQILCLDDNALSGTVPSAISSLSNLSTLEVNNNNLNGQLPDLSSNMYLQMLIAGHNPFDTAEIPSWIINMRNIYLLSLDAANLTGSIPAEIFGFSSFLSNVSLGSNYLNGTLNLTEANPSSLLFVNLSDNDIIALEKGNYTQKLLMNGNPYCEMDSSACNPTQVGTLEAPAMGTECTNDCDPEYAINKKDSSSCQCAYPVVSTCNFPASRYPTLSNFVSEMEHIIAAGLNGSQYLEGILIQDTQVVVDVSSANEIRISVFPPSNMTAWPSRNVTVISYAIKNRDIDFDPIGAVLCEYTGTYWKLQVVTRLSRGAIVGLVIGAVVLAIVIFVLVLYAMRIKKRALKAEKLNKPFAAWIGTGQGLSVHVPHLKGARWFSLGEIRSCTNNFSQSNEIGEGGYGKVYKGFLSSGERVAIKRAHAHLLQGTAEFKTEIELLSRVHHINLVGLLGFCFEEREQILVYEYMPNGTLTDCLSGRTGLRMDWSRRIEILLGSARGIAYLHTEANPPIIHGDIKSCNILLDEKLVAKVADFGLSELLLDGRLSVETAQVKGTLGYLDPDYYMTNQLTSKSDVYSFGVVLFEVITGRLPIEGGKCVARQVAKLHGATGIDGVVQEWVDPHLDEYPRKGLGWLLEIALNCMKDDPQERLSMAEVVKELEVLSGPPSEMAKSLSINMYKNRSERDDQALIQEKYGSSSFEYSGSYIGISTPLEPK
ncbi:hypothetical protein GOP47_0004187 [Adiantum capillus-veneris]|uniref:Protein kinase domain-containing protein n=1 Tax=Adiantum capillus-veneris TaxID=13818 RepID=A0A9D4V7L9_ADICA|nr:hypothetical protein GOP47_0004187 [Adiantum capillus-veneris]